MSTNVFVRDMDLAVHNGLDSRRLEVVADGLTPWRGAQLAIDTTMVSLLRRDGTTRPRAANFDGAALEVARRRKDVTYPELSGEGGESAPRCPGSRSGREVECGDGTIPHCTGESSSPGGALDLARPGRDSLGETVERHIGVYCHPCFCLVALGQAPCLWL